MGICYSNGIICDFAGPYTVNEAGDMAFGKPTRYLVIADVDASVWDLNISKANGVYCERMHNLFCDNCHSHVAWALNGMAYKGNRNWNMVVLAFWMFFRGKFCSWGSVVVQFAPFLSLVFVIWLLDKM